MTTPSTPVAQRGLTMMQGGVIQLNVRQQLATLLSAPAVRANLNAGCYVPPDLEEATKAVIDQTLALVMIEICQS